MSANDLLRARLRRAWVAAMDLARALAAKFHGWPRRDLRLIDEIEATVSVLLAIGLAHLLDARNIGWAAFSGYMVMRARLGECFMRGCLRILGTSAGALSAWWLAGYVAGSPVWTSVALGVVGFLTLHMALVGRRSYAWLFTGLTFAMVLIDGMQHPDEPLSAFAHSRFIEVFTGTCVAVLVSAVSTWTVRRRLGATMEEQVAQAAARRAPLWHRESLWHAAQGALALMLIPWAWQWWQMAALPQSSTTIFAVMMVPLASLAVSSRATRDKLLYRFIGCSVGGVLASAILVLAHAWPLLLLLAVALGVAAGRHVENGGQGIGYIGTQFVLAFLVVLVPDNYAQVDIAPGIHRLLGIFFGMLMLEPVRMAGSFVRRRFFDGQTHSPQL